MSACRILIFGLLVLPLASCGSEQPPRESKVIASAPATLAKPAPAPRAAPPAAVATSAGAASAAEVLRTYYAAIEAGHYDQAYALRWHGGARDPGVAAFAANFARYADYHATIGAPGEMLAAAGSLYIDVPVQVVGTLKSGAPFGSAGTVTLRRAGDVDGSTPDQRRWRIYR